MSRGPALGLVGCGAWGRRILTDLVALGARVVVADPAAAAREAASAGGAAGTVATAAELPAGLDGLVVATPASTHFGVVAALLPGGLPIFLEKPMTCDPGQAAELARQGAGRLFVMEKWREHGGIRTLAGMAAECRLGEPLALSTRRLQWGCPGTDVDPVWTLAPHDLSIVDQVLGELPALRGAVGVARPAPVGVAGAGPWLDEVSAWMGTRVAVSLLVSGRQPRRERRVVLTCTEGLAVLADPLADHLEIHRGPPRRTGREDPDPEPERLPIDTALPLRRELERFCGFLRGGPPPRCDAARGARMVAALAGIRAAALGRTGA